MSNKERTMHQLLKLLLELSHASKLHEVLLDIFIFRPRVVILVLQSDIPVANAMVLIDAECVGTTDSDGLTRSFRLTRSRTALVYIKVGQNYHQIGRASRLSLDGHLLVVRIPTRRGDHGKPANGDGAAATEDGATPTNLVI